MLNVLQPPSCNPPSYNAKKSTFSKRTYSDKSLTTVLYLFAYFFCNIIMAGGPMYIYCKGRACLTCNMPNRMPQQSIITEREVSLRFVFSHVQSIPMKKNVRNIIPVTLENMDHFCNNVIVCRKEVTHTTTN